MWGGGWFQARPNTCPQPPEWLWCPPSQGTLIALFLGNKVARAQSQLFSLTFMGPCTFNVFLSSTNKMQLYAVFVSCCQCSTCFKWFFRSSSGAQKLYMQHTNLTSMRCCMYSFWAHDDERKNRLKHVEHQQQETNIV